MAELICKLYVAWEDHSGIVKSKECVHYDYINSYCKIEDTECPYEGRGISYEVKQEDDGEPD